MSTTATHAPVEKKTGTPKGTGKGGKPATPAKPKVKKEKEPKVYVFGGSIDKPELGANSRRLWKWVTENLSKKDQATLKSAVLAKQAALAVPDRFVRWQRVCEAAQEKGLKGKGDVELNQALVRRLQAEDKDGLIGKDASIRIH